MNKTENTGKKLRDLFFNGHTDHRGRRAWMSVAGVLIMGAAVGLFQYAGLGMDPFQVFAHGLSYVLPLSFGNLYTSLSVVLFVLVVCLDRRKIGLGTLINMFFLGYVVDAAEAVCRSFLPENAGIAFRLVVLLAALVILCLATSLYMVADLGVSVYDAIAMHWSERSGKRFFVCRIITDLVCVTVGSAFCVAADGRVGGNLLVTTVGIGTVITAFWMGPVISFFAEHFARKILER